MHVIPFPQWRIFFFVDNHGRNVIRHWLNELEASDADRWTFQALLDICEFSGPEALSSCTWDLGNGFYSLTSKHKGGLELSPVFVNGPFGDSEITFLAGARIVGKALKPAYAVGVAQENLDILREQPYRRRRERVT
jgi:hypothetical protein